MRTTDQRKKTLAFNSSSPYSIPPRRNHMRKAPIQPQPFVPQPLGNLPSTPLQISSMANNTDRILNEILSKVNNVQSDLQNVKSQVENHSDQFEAMASGRNGSVLDMEHEDNDPVFLEERGPPQAPPPPPQRQQTPAAHRGGGWWVKGRDSGRWVYIVPPRR